MGSTRWESDTVVFKQEEAESFEFWPVSLEHL